MSGPKAFTARHLQNPNIILIDAQTLSMLGTVLWDIRTMQDIKQKDVAERMGILQCHVSSLENGELLKIPKIPTFVNYLNSIDYDLFAIKRGTIKF